MAPWPSGFGVSAAGETFSTILTKDPRSLRGACLAQIKAFGTAIAASAETLNAAHGDGAQDGKRLADIERASTHVLALHSVVSQIDGDLVARRAEEQAERQRALEGRLEALDDLLDRLPEIPRGGRAALRQAIKRRGIDVAWLRSATPEMLVDLPGIGWKRADAICDALRLAGLDGGQS